MELDLGNDGSGDTSTVPETGCLRPSGKVSDITGWEDIEYIVNPGMREGLADNAVCTDILDNECNGEVDSDDSG